MQFLVEISPSVAPSFPFPHTQTSRQRDIESHVLRAVFAIPLLTLFITVDCKKAPFGEPLAKRRQQPSGMLYDCACTRHWRVIRSYRQTPCCRTMPHATCHLKSATRRLIHSRQSLLCVEHLQLAKYMHNLSLQPSHTDLDWDSVRRQYDDADTKDA